MKEAFEKMIWDRKFVREYESLRKEAKNFVKLSKEFSYAIKVEKSWFEKGYEDLAVEAWIRGALKTFTLILLRLLCW
jgi:hypothetical protein